MTSVDRKADPWGRLLLTHGSDAVALLYAGGDLAKVGLDPADPVVIEFNQAAARFNKDAEKIGALPVPDHSPEEEHARRLATWNIPEPFASLDLAEYLLEKCTTEAEQDRVMEELDLYEQKNLTPLLRIALMLVDHFRKNQIVWGVGRGSSVASYCLYLIGLNRLNPLDFDLSISEFLR